MLYFKNISLGVKGVYFDGSVAEFCTYCVNDNSGGECGASD